MPFLDGNKLFFPAERGASEGHRLHFQYRTEVAGSVYVGFLLGLIFDSEEGATGLLKHSYFSLHIIQHFHV
jgi:hypothetical protein